MILYFFMEVESIGNTQIIHMEETGITQQTIGLMFVKEMGTLFKGACYSKEDIN